MQILQGQNLTDHTSDGHLIHIVRDLRDALPEVPSNLEPMQATTSDPPIITPRPIQYPQHIFENAWQVEPLNPDKGRYYHIWNLVLAFWFPRSEGYDIQMDWCGPYGHELPFHQRVPLAVLRRGQPIVLVLIDGLTDSNINDYSRQTAHSAANELFDHVSIWSGHPLLCVISALGMRWNAFLRSTDLTSDQAQQSLGYDWFGEWSEEVVTDQSRDTLDQCFRALKESAPDGTLQDEDHRLLQPPLELPTQYSPDLFRFEEPSRPPLRVRWA